MNYGIHFPDCTENCRDCLLIATSVQLQRLKGALYRRWRRVHVELRDDDAAVPDDAHDGEGVHSRFSESSKYCMA